MRQTFMFVLFFLSVPAYCQDELKFGDTEKTNDNPTYESEKRKFRKKRKVELIFRNSDSLLEGNRCFEDYLEENRIHLSAPISGEKGYSGLVRVLRNTGARIRGTFIGGPFWVARMKKKRRECRNALHDFIG